MNLKRSVRARTNPQVIVEFDAEDVREIENGLVLRIIGLGCCDVGLMPLISSYTFSNHQGVGRHKAREIRININIPSVCPRGERLKDIVSAICP